MYSTCIAVTSHTPAVHVQGGAPKQQSGTSALCVVHRALFVFMLRVIQLYRRIHLCVAPHMLTIERMIMPAQQ